MTLQESVSQYKSNGPISLFSYLERIYFYNTLQWKTDDKYYSKIYIIEFDIIITKVVVSNGTVLIVT